MKKDEFFEAIAKLFKPAPKVDTYAEMDAIMNCLVDAREYDLESEVVWSALHAMKLDPSLTIQDAINIGHGEWIK